MKRSAICLGVILGLAGCSQGRLTTSPDPVARSVESFQLARPLRYGGTAPEFSGNWSGTARQGGCRSIGACRFDPTPWTVSLRIAQDGTALTGAYNSLPMIGYVSEDRGLFLEFAGSAARATLHLQPASDALSGILVEDELRGGFVILSKSYEVTSFRRE